LIAILGTGQRRQQHQSYILYSSCRALKNLPSPDSKSCIQHSSSLTHSPSVSLPQSHSPSVSLPQSRSTRTWSPFLNSWSLHALLPCLVLDSSHLHSATSFSQSISLILALSQHQSLPSVSFTFVLTILYSSYSHSPSVSLPQSHSTRTYSPLLSFIQLLVSLPQSLPAGSLNHILSQLRSLIPDATLSPTLSLIPSYLHSTLFSIYFSAYLIVQSIQSARLSVQSSELGPLPSHESDCCSPPPFGS